MSLAAQATPSKHNHAPACANRSHRNKMANRARRALLRYFTNEIFSRYKGTHAWVATIIRVFFFRLDIMNGSDYMRLSHYEILREMTASGVSLKLNQKWYDSGKRVFRSSYWRMMKDCTFRPYSFGDRKGDDPAHEELCLLVRVQPASGEKGKWERNIYRLSPLAINLLRKEFKRDPHNLALLIGEKAAGITEREEEARAESEARAEARKVDRSDKKERKPRDRSKSKRKPRVKQMPHGEHTPITDGLKKKAHETIAQEERRLAAEARAEKSLKKELHAETLSARIEEDSDARFLHQKMMERIEKNKACDDLLYTVINLRPEEPVKNTCQKFGISPAYLFNPEQLFSLQGTIQNYLKEQAAQQEEPATYTLQEALAKGFADQKAVKQETVGILHTSLLPPKDANLKNEPKTEQNHPSSDETAKNVNFQETPICNLPQQKKNFSSTECRFRHSNSSSSFHSEEEKDEFPPYPPSRQDAPVPDERSESRHQDLATCSSDELTENGPTTLDKAHLIAEVARKNYGVANEVSINLVEQDLADHGVTIDSVIKRAIPAIPTTKEKTKFSQIEEKKEEKEISLKGGFSSLGKVLDFVMDQPKPSAGEKPYQIDTDASCGEKTQKDERKAMKKFPDLREVQAAILEEDEKKTPEWGRFEYNNRGEVPSARNVFSCVDSTQFYEKEEKNLSLEEQIQAIPDRGGPTGEIKAMGLRLLKLVQNKK